MAQKLPEGRVDWLGRGEQQLKRWIAGYKAREALHSAEIIRVHSLTRGAKIQAQGLYQAVFIQAGIQNQRCCLCSVFRLPCAQSSPRVANNRSKSSEQLKAK